eukprot:gene26079-34098_t
MNKPINVHSLDMLPLYLEMSQGQFLSSFEHLQHLEACKDRPSVLDDDIVNRTIKLYEEQKEYNLLTLEQCRRWRLQKPSAHELEDIERVETYVKKLQQVNTQILFLAYHYKEHTIDRILEKDEGELAIDLMMGKLYDPSGEVKEVTPFGPGSAHDATIFHFPNQQAINAFYATQATSELVIPSSLAHVYHEYVKQRVILNDFYEACFNEGLKDTTIIAKELGNYDPVKERAVIQNDAEMNVFCDYLSLYRQKNGVRFVTDWLEKHQNRLTNTNTRVIEGFTNARFAVLRLDKNMAFGGIQCLDMISQKPYLLMDRALNASNKQGCFFICSIIDMGDYIMTTGGGIPVDGRSMGGKAILTLVADCITDFRTTEEPYTDAIGNAVRKIYGFCLRNGTLTHIGANMSF